MQRFLRLSTSGEFTFEEEIGLEVYHGAPKRISSIPPERRQFIAWDGEGVNLSGPGKPQSYILYGCSTGDYISSTTHLHTFELLDLVFRVAREYPACIHVGYAFGYDANMLLRSLRQSVLTKLHKEGRITLTRGNQRYHIQYLPSKWLSLTEYGQNYSRDKNPNDKTTVRIYDIFGFFVKSFEEAYKELIGPVPVELSEGKKRRGQFEISNFQYILKYWKIEIQMLKELVEELRRRLYGAGLRITSWHGPGALASYVLRQHRIQEHMLKAPDEVRRASRYAYAGGRFEPYIIGRVQGPIYSMDINSAYPYGISLLPSFRNGGWEHVSGKISRIARFGVYHIRMHPRSGGTYLERSPAPLFHRDPMGNITYPWIVDGWYWSPEVRNLRRLPRELYEIVEGWEFHGGYDEQPFSWVEDAYKTRRKWKSEGLASQLALKLMLNSLYGKMAQRVGWDSVKNESPRWHQLEWAGWTTSNTRAMIWDASYRALEVIARTGGNGRLIAVETDGLYTTVDPSEMGIVDSTELGGWEVDVYDEIMYVQSGLAWLRKGDKWICKRRGLDKKTFSLDACREYLRTLKPKDNWEPYEGETTRFIGLGAALQSSEPFRNIHCRWDTKVRRVRPGYVGKRVHIHAQCSSCDAGLSGYDGPHDLSIRSRAFVDPCSHPHDIPWEGGPDAAWRKTQTVERESYDFNEV